MQKRTTPIKLGVRRRLRSPQQFFFLVSFLLQFFATSVTSQSFNYTDLQRCTLSTFELSQLMRGDPLQPCILYDVIPTYQDAAVVTMVQVTPAECSHHRDGAYIAVRKMNADHNGKGVTIGFHGDHSVRFSM